MERQARFTGPLWRDFSFRELHTQVFRDLAGYIHVEADELTVPGPHGARSEERDADTEQPAGLDLFDHARRRSLRQGLACLPEQTSKNQGRQPGRDGAKPSPFHHSVPPPRLSRSHSLRDVLWPRRRSHGGSAERHALDRNAVQEPALTGIVVERIVPGAAIVPEGQRPRTPLESIGEFRPRRMLVEVLQERA